MEVSSGMAISAKMKSFAEKSSWIRKMFEEGAKMKAAYGAENVFDFSIGNPDVAPPEAFQLALQRIVADTSPGIHGYMPNAGYTTTRQAIADRMTAEQEVKIEATDTIMTCGAAGGLNIILKAILNPGEEVIMLAPYFVDYRFYIDNHGGVPVVVETDAESNLDLTALEKALTDKTKAIIINSPNNPSGQIYSAEALAALGDLLSSAGKKFGTTIFLLADEPYRKIVFDGHTVPSIFKACKNSIVATSFSKDLSLPGERIGYLAVHPEITEKAALLGALTMANRILGFINAPALMQRAIAELQFDTIADVSIYARRKELLCNILADAGYQFARPKGSLYVFPKTPIADDVKFVAMLQQEKVLAVPGVGFGRPGYMRLAFCVPDEVIVKSAAGFKRAMELAKAD